MERKKRLKIWLIILATVFLLGILFFIFIQIYVNRSAKNYIRTIDHLVGADAVLILGSRVYSDGTPSPAARAVRQGLGSGMKSYTV